MYPTCEAKPYAGIDGVGRAHVAVARHLRDDRRRGDRGALRVAVDDRAMRRGRRAEPEAVDERDVGGLARPQRLAQSAQVGLVQPVAVDHPGREHVHRDALRAREHRAIELVARRLVDLLRVVQQRERTHAVVAQRGVVEEHAGDDERACERSASRLVGARDEPHAEIAVVAKELLAGPLRRHRPRIASARATHRAFHAWSEESQRLHTVACGEQLHDRNRVGDVEHVQSIGERRTRQMKSARADMPRRLEPRAAGHLPSTPCVVAQASVR